MRKFIKVLLAALFSLSYIAIAQSDTLTLQRADDSSYEMEGEVEHYRDSKFVVVFSAGGKMSIPLEQVQKIEFSRSSAKAGAFGDNLRLKEGDNTSYIFKSRIKRYEDNKFFVVSSSGEEATFPIAHVQTIEFLGAQDRGFPKTSKSHTAGPDVEKNIANDEKWENEADDAKGGKRQTDQIIEKLTDARSICKHLQAELRNEDYLKKLQIAFEDIDDKDIKGCLGCTFIMGYFYVGDDKTARKFRQNFGECFPNCPYLKLIQPENLGATCNKCGGDGKINVKCPKCKGSGICTMCKGQGFLLSSITDEKVKCPKCQGTGNCRKCKGTGQVSEMCRECRGKGVVISKARIEEAYVGLLSKSIEQLSIAEQIARGIVKIEDKRITSETISQIQAESDGKESEELIAKLKNYEVVYYAYGTLRDFGTSLWELSVETNLFKDDEGKQIKSNLSVNGNKVSLKLAMETGNMVFNFRLQEGIAILCNSTVNRETIDALTAVVILGGLMEDAQVFNPTQDEMKKARVAARKMLSNDSGTGESAMGMETVLAFWLFFALVGMAIGIRKGMHPAVAFIGSLLLGILAPLMVFVTTTVKKCPQCTEQVKKNALVCKHCGYKFKKIESMRVSCPLCGREFDYQVDVDRKGTIRLRINCPHCKQKSFKSVRIQPENVISVTDDLAQKQRLKNAKTTLWKCGFCDRQFGTKTEAEEHEKTCKSRR